MSDYPNTPGFYPHAPETSKDAATSVAGAAKSRERMALVLIGANGPKGCTVDEVEATFEWERRSAAPRLSTLKAKNEIVDSELRRTGLSGCRFPLGSDPVFPSRIDPGDGMSRRAGFGSSW